MANRGNKPTKSPSAIGDHLLNYPEYSKKFITYKNTFFFAQIVFKLRFMFRAEPGSILRVCVFSPCNLKTSQKQGTK